MTVLGFPIGLGGAPNLLASCKPIKIGRMTDRRTQDPRVSAINKLKSALGGLPSSLGKPATEFGLWHDDTVRVLRAVFGDTSQVVKNFRGIQFYVINVSSGPMLESPSDHAARVKVVFDAGCARAKEMLVDLTQLVETMSHYQPPVEPTRPVADVAKYLLHDAGKSIPPNEQALFPSMNLQSWRQLAIETLESVFGVDSSAVRQFARIRFESTQKSSDWREQLSRNQEAYRDGCDRARQSLRELIEAVGTGQEDRPTLSSSKTTPSPLGNKKVFVVHGHDGALKNAVARFIQKLDLEEIVLHEQPDRGQTVIEKFEASAHVVGYAVVLATADDLAVSQKQIQKRVSAALTPDELNKRARQNVIFELGYFAGRLGRGRVLLVTDAGIELPSDLSGVIYAARNEWQLKLNESLIDAGYEFTVQQGRAALAIRE